MSPAAILALISDLYTQVDRLTQERDELARRLAANEAPDEPGPP